MYCTAFKTWINKYNIKKETVADHHSFVYCIFMGTISVDLVQYHIHPRISYPAKETDQDHKC